MKVLFIIIAMFWIASTASLQLKCQMVFGNSCINVDAVTSKLDQDKARVTEIDIGERNESMIESITFMHTRTEYLPLNMFEHFTSVKKLFVFQTLAGMSAPKNGHFFSAEKLEQIVIVNQRLEELGKRVFEGAISLKTLKLDNNGINTLDQDVFNGIDTLQRLYLSSNELKALPKEIFSTLTDLHYVDLNSNMLSSLPKGIFDKNRFLEKIKLSFNRFLMIPRWNVAEHTHYTFIDNLCVDKIFERTSQLNEYMPEHCNIDMSPEDLVLSYRAHDEIDSICNDKNSITILQGDLVTLRSQKEQLMLENEHMEHKIIKEKLYKNSLC